MSTNKKYSILVKTGSVKHAGTSAKVCIKLYGSNGDSEIIHLDHKGYDDFENDNSDAFTKIIDNIGIINEIEMSHDNTGSKPGWFLDFVIVVDIENNVVYKGNFNTWLKEAHLSQKVAVDPINAVCI